MMTGFKVRDRPITQGDEVSLERAASEIDRGEKERVTKAIKA